MTCLSHFSTFFAKRIPKMHKITSNFYDMRKILTKIFQSHGTPLGYLGAGSQEALGLGACWFQILVIWGPCDLPVPVALQFQAKNLKSAGARCDSILRKNDFFNYEMSFPRRRGLKKKL